MENGFSNEIRYSKVGGWLVLFIILVFISPLGILLEALDTISPITDTLLKITEEYKEASFYNSSFLLLSLSLLFTIGLGIGVSIFAIITGSRLVKITSNALHTAQKFLIYYLFFGVILAVIKLAHAFIFTKQDIFVLITNPLQTFVSFAGFFAIWLSYLKKSKRVLATYPSVPSPSILGRPMPLILFVVILLIVIGVFLYSTVFNFHQIFDTEVIGPYRPLPKF